MQHLYRLTFARVVHAGGQRFPASSTGQTELVQVPTVKRKTYCVLICLVQLDEGDVMIKRGGNGWRGPVEWFPSNVGRLAPSTDRRNIGRTRSLFKACCTLAVAMLMTAGTKPMDDAGAAATAETLPTMDETRASGSARQQRPRAEISARNLHEGTLRDLGSTDQCTAHPLWGKEVDPAKYMFGCKEIEVAIVPTPYHTKYLHIVSSICIA